MEFEFDKRKSAGNLKKHGIDFLTAQWLWEDPGLIEVSAQTVDEPRRLVIGEIAGRHWSAVIAYRNEVIRIISVRHSRKNEVLLYEKNNS